VTKLTKLPNEPLRPGAPLGIIRAGSRTAEQIAGHSRAALDRPLAHPGELWVAVTGDSAVTWGAFQRTDARPGAPALAPRLRRASGGPAVALGEGTVHVALALAHPGAIVPCDEKRIVNRYVRPLLRALTRAFPRGAQAARPGTQAHFFGGDWVDMLHRPVAWVGFAHDAASRRTLFEAFVAVRTPFAGGGRAAFRGKAPATLEELAGATLDPHRIADAIVEAYASLSGGSPAAEPTPDKTPPDQAPPDDMGDPPWAAAIEEAIGIVAAGPDARGVLRVGGDLLVSRDALARLEARIAAGDDPSRAVDETLAAPGVAIDGVRSLTSVRDVIVRAQAPRSAPL
jgi:hypothetical protein